MSLLDLMHEGDHIVIHTSNKTKELDQIIEVLRPKYCFHSFLYWIKDIYLNLKKSEFVTWSFSLYYIEFSTFAAAKRMASYKSRLLFDGDKTIENHLIVNSNSESENLHKESFS